MMNRRSSDRGLFRNTELRILIEDKIKTATNEVAGMGVHVFEANSDEQIVDHVCSKYPLIPLALNVEAKDTKFSEKKIDVSDDPGRIFFSDYGEFLIDGYKVTWSIPITGSVELFHAQPSTYMLSRIPGEIYEKSLNLTIEMPADNSDEQKIVNGLESQLNSVQQMVEHINKDLMSYSSSLKSEVVVTTAKRRQELEKIAHIKQALKANINEKNESATPLRPINIQVNKLTPLSKNKGDPGWCIDDNDYEHILSSIRNMGATMEATRASESRDEESLRDMMLVGLDASMKLGTAAGELFRKNGKTDISILFENKAAFVAECKLWQGESYMIDGISQLLGYLTWRDAKTSLVLFNKKNQNFSMIQDKILEILKKHPNFLKIVAARDGEWRAVFSKPDDAGRMITIHVFLFDVYERKKK